MPSTRLPAPFHSSQSLSIPFVPLHYSHRYEDQPWILTMLTTLTFSLHVLFLIRVHSQGLILHQYFVIGDYDCIHCVKTVPTYPKQFFLGVILEFKENKGPFQNITNRLGHGIQQGTRALRRKEV